jgi:hypothetical protein
MAVDLGPRNPLSCRKSANAGQEASPAIPRRTPSLTFLRNLSPIVGDPSGPLKALRIHPCLVNDFDGPVVKSRLKPAATDSESVPRCRQGDAGTGPGFTSKQSGIAAHFKITRAPRWDTHRRMRRTGSSGIPDSPCIACPGCPRPPPEFFPRSFQAVSPSPRPSRSARIRGNGVP